MRTTLTILFIILIQEVSCAWKSVYNNDPSVQCYNKNALGKYACCCYDTKCADQGWELPCGGDLDSTCSADELRGEGPGNGFNQTSLNAGPCPLPPGCAKVQWKYSWQCCKAPAIGNWSPYHLSGPPDPYCPSAPFFVGCTAPNEILTPDNSTCVNTTCPGITAASPPTSVSHQIVVSNDFKSDVSALIACAKNMGAKSTLLVQSTSRCGRNPEDTARLGTNQFSLHQVGMAIDVLLQLPDGTACNQTCMGQGYCAYHQTSPSCANSASCPGCHGQTKTTRNQWINGFFECATKITGLQAGATFPVGDWNHFERDVANRGTAAQKFVPQLKAFCHGLCPGKAKGNIGDSMCSCPGFNT